MKKFFLISILLFQPGGAGPETACPVNASIQTMLADLSTPEKINAVVDSATRVPFDTACGKIHYAVMRGFLDHRIESEIYKAFLMFQLDTIARPSDDYRTQIILRYLTRDGIIEHREWASGLRAIRRIGGARLAGHLSPLLYRTDSDSAETCKRINEFFGLVRFGRVGHPDPVGFNRAFMEMADAFKYVYNKDTRMLRYCYRRFHTELTFDPGMARNIHVFLENLYLNAESDTAGAEIMGWMDQALEHPGLAALTAAGDPGALKTLSALLGSRMPGVSDKAMNKLASAGRLAVPCLVERIQESQLDSVKVYAARTLEMIGPEARADIEKMLNSPDTSLHPAAREALKAMGD